MGRTFFVLFVLIYLLKPHFGTNFINGIVNITTLNFFKKSIYNLQKILKNYSFPCFLIVHFYLCFLVLHWVCLWTNSMDPYLEYCYHLLNILRLSIFPLVIFFFILQNIDIVLPSTNLMVSNIKEYVEVFKEIYQGAVDFSKKNPKTSMTVVAGTAVLGGVALNGSSTTKFIEKCESHPHLTGLSDLPVEKCVNSRSRNIRENLEHVITQSQETPLSVGFNIISRALNNQASLSDDYSRLTREINSFKWDQMDLERSLTDTTLSNALNSVKNNEVSDSVDHEVASDLTQIEVPSILESKISFFNYFF